MNNSVNKTKPEVYAKPNINAYEEETQYSVFFEMSGVLQDQIELQIKNNVLEVIAHRSETPETSKKLTYTEHQVYNLKRSIQLPEDADGSNIDAELKNGVLKVTVQKLVPEQNQPRKIAVKVN